VLGRTSKPTKGPLVPMASPLTNSSSPSGTIGQKFADNSWKGLTIRDRPDVSQFPNRMAASEISEFRM
jgi:hypothetical protein